MADDENEEMSLCENVPSAINSHYHRPLYGAHKKRIMNNIDKHSNEVQGTFEQIKDKSTKTRTIYNNVVISLDEWRTRQLEKVEEIYQHELQLIQFREEILNKFREHLLQRLADGATQNLERVQRQNNSNIEILYSIRQTIEIVREESIQLQWNFPPSLPTDIEFSSSDFPLVPILIQKPPTDMI